MCHLLIPRHPWCDCANPTAVDARGNPTCNHHIWTYPSSVAHLKPKSPLPLHGGAYVKALLAHIHRPAPAWQHCPIYYENSYTSESSGVLIPGRELYCPVTKRLKERGGFKQFYYWNGLCPDCNSPRRCGDINLPLVPLRRRGFRPPRPAGSASAPAEKEEEEGWETFDWHEVDKGLEKKMMRDGRRAGKTGSLIFVHVVQVKDRKRKWVVDRNLSAVYELTGYCDPELAREVEGKKGRGQKAEV
jgi:hypothetical protein